MQEVQDTTEDVKMFSEHCCVLGSPAELLKLGLSAAPTLCRNLWAWAPGIGVLLKPPGSSDVHSD